MLRLVIKGGIRLYQWTLSPLLVLLTGPGGGCRFEPSCSAYFLEAVETWGALRGSWLGLKRLGRCHPWGGQGFDPVPKPEHHASCAAAHQLACE
jgi:putative membrane protein insertion efficiency factor